MDKADSPERNLSSMNSVTSLQKQFYGANNYGQYGHNGLLVFWITDGDHDNPSSDAAYHLSG